MLDKHSGGCETTPDMSKLMTGKPSGIIHNLLPLFAALLGYCELACTFKVLTWRIMPDAGEAEDGGPDGPY